MVNKNVFQGPLPKGATKKEELVFRKTGITVTPIKTKKPFKFPFALKKTKKKPKKISFPIPKGIDIKLAGKVLRERQKRTLMRVIESQASPSAKARARLMLTKLK